MKYLVKTTSDYYKIRIRIKESLQPYFTKREINKSLNTKVHKEALLLSQKILTGYNRICLSHSIGLYTDELLKENINSFIEKTLKQPKPKDYTKPDPTQKTHSQALQEFIRYYRELDIGDEKRNLLINFLEDVFIPLIDGKSPVVSTNLDKMLKIKKILEGFPKRSKGKYKNLTMGQLLKLKRVPQEDRIAPKTLDFYFIACKRFYNYCIAQGYLTINPCNFITIKKVSIAQEEREPFSNEEMCQLLDLFDKEEEIKKDILYTLAYTGLRASELWKGELKKSREGIYYIDLTNPKLKLKTKSSHRIVPLHQELISRGIHIRLPFILKKIKQRVILDNFAKRIKPQVTTSPKKVLYSMRHSVATQLKYIGVDSLVISELLGHSHSGMTMGRYASRYPLTILKEAMDKLSYY